MHNVFITPMIRRSKGFLIVFVVVGVVEFPVRRSILINYFPDSKFKKNRRFSGLRF